MVRSKLKKTEGMGQDLHDACVKKQSTRFSISKRRCQGHLDILLLLQIIRANICNSFLFLSWCGVSRSHLSHTNSHHGTSDHSSPYPRESTGQSPVAVHRALILQLFGWHWVFWMMSTEVKILEFLLTASCQVSLTVSITGRLGKFN